MARADVKWPTALLNPSHINLTRTICSTAPIEVPLSSPGTYFAPLNTDLQPSHHLVLVLVLVLVLLPLLNYPSKPTRPAPRSHYPTHLDPPPPPPCHHQSNVRIPSSWMPILAPSSMISLPLVSPSSTLTPLRSPPLHQTSHRPTRISISSQ